MTDAQRRQQANRDNQGRYAEGAGASLEAATPDLTATPASGDQPSVTERFSSTPAELVRADTMIAEQRHHVRFHHQATTDEREAAAAADLIVRLSGQRLAAAIRRQWPDAHSVDLEENYADEDDPEAAGRYEVIAVRDAQGTQLARSWDNDEDDIALLEVNQTAYNMDISDWDLASDPSHPTATVADIETKHGHLELGDLSRCDRDLLAITQRYREAYERIEDTALDDLTRATRRYPQAATWHLREHPDGYNRYQFDRALAADGTVVPVDDETANELDEQLRSLRADSAKLSTIGKVDRDFGGPFGFQQTFRIEAPGLMQRYQSRQAI